MKFLIPTEPDDTHALFVKLALESMDHDVRLIFLADQPTKLKNTVYIDNDRYEWKSLDQYTCVSEIDYDVVWWRRARHPHLPKNSAHPDDHKFMVRENKIFYESLTNTMAPNARWVNTKDAGLRANSKLLQLKEAVACGMTIPTTLCSNDPQEIRYFLLKHESEGVIYKPLCSNFWFEQQGMRISYTSKLSFLELPSNKSLQLTPSIFQKEIKKKYELRVTYFDGYIVTAKLNSQDHVAGMVDWRAIPGKEMAIEPYTLPTALEQQIQAFMKKMGLVFGALDFIVNADGEYIFLEVNEQGQFLWIEELNPEFKMLDIFVNFMLNQAPSFQWNQDAARHSLKKYRHQTSRLTAINMRRHVGLNNAKAYNS
jgi:glutathione synthase/RimK-type ligase-like ATP-grasp enzyme